MAKHLRVLLLALLLIASPFMHVTRRQSDLDEQAAEGTKGSDVEIVNNESPEYGDGNFSPASGVDTVCVFRKNSARLVSAGEESELLVGMKNDGETSLDVIAIRASVHLPANHEWLIQNLTAQGFRNASVRVKTQASFPYIYAVSKFLQPGTYDLVGTSLLRD